MAMPGVTEEIADAVRAARDPSELEFNGGIAWLVTNGPLTKEQFKELDPYITGRSQVFRVQVVGYFEQGGPSVRVEAVDVHQDERAALDGF